MNKKHKSFETERLRIILTTEIDASFILELLNTPKWIKFIGDRNVHSVDDAKEYIQQKMLPQLEKLGYGNYTVIRKLDGEKIGTCGLYDREGLEGIDIGFAFLSQFEKQGYAFESVSKLLEVAIHDFKINKISAITIKTNVDSQKLLTKIGLTFKEYIRIPNDDEELMLYTL
jgi:RimJ/RimL family protein N-acetyltransferase